MSKRKSVKKPTWTKLSTQDIEIITGIIDSWKPDSEKNLTWHNSSFVQRTRGLGEHTTGQR